MASQTLRPHRSPSPSPSPSTPVNPANPAKLTRQSLGPPPSSTAARGFAGLGISHPSMGPLGTPGSQPRHASSNVALGMSGGRDSLSPRPSGTTPGMRAMSGNAGRPSSEFLPGGGGGRELKTPETEQIDQWFKHLASWENTLEEMAAASTDQNFTEELGAIEQWFRVLSEAERTAALYSLLQHSTPVQIRFFLSVLHHMAQSDPMSALPSPNLGMQSGMQAQMESKLASMNMKSPSAGGGSGFPGSPTVYQYLAPESAMDGSAAANKSRLRQNRISAPGTLQPSDSRWQQQLDQVVERGSSPGVESVSSNRSRTPEPDLRPKSTDFAGLANQSETSGPFTRSPRQSDISNSAGSPINSPLVNGNWASMTNTPLVPMFTDPGNKFGDALTLANWQLAAVAANNTNTANRVALEDARKFRRPGAGQSARNVSGQYNDDGELVNSAATQPGKPMSPLGNGGFGGQTWSRSPVPGSEFGLGMGLPTDQTALAGLGMSLANLNLGMTIPLMNANAAQMLAMAQAQQLSANSYTAGYGGLNLNLPRSGQRPQGGPGRKSPMLGGKSHSPTPGAGTGGGGAGGGAGVAGPEDVDVKVLEDVAQWLRVLRLHKYTTNFEKAKWRDMVLMTDDDLQAKGVAALGARNKMLKTFHNIRTRFDIPHPEGQEEYAPSKTE